MFVLVNVIGELGMWHIPLIPALRKQRQKDLFEFEGSLNYKVRLCLKLNKQNM